MAGFKYLPPDSQTPVDSVGYRDWFYRLGTAVSELFNQVSSGATTATFAGNYLPLSLGVEPIQIVGDGTGNMILIWYDPNG